METTNKITVMRINLWDGSVEKVYSGVDDSIYEFNPGRVLEIRKLPRGFYEQDFEEIANSIKLNELPILYKSNEVVEKVYNLGYETTIVICRSKLNRIIYVVTNELQCDLSKIGV